MERQGFSLQIHSSCIYISYVCSRATQMKKCIIYKNKTFTYKQMISAYFIITTEHSTLSLLWLCEWLSSVSVCWRWTHSISTMFKDCCCQRHFNSCSNRAITNKQKQINKGCFCHVCFIAKQQVSAFICHLFRIRQQKIPILNPRAKFTLNWLQGDNIRYAALQLYGLLADLDLTGSLSLAAWNKHLLGYFWNYSKLIGTPVLSAICFQYERETTGTQCFFVYFDIVLDA